MSYALIIGSQPATIIYLSVTSKHLIASFEAMKLLTILLSPKSMHLIILSQEAVKSILNSLLTNPHEIGSANLKIEIYNPDSKSHYLTVQSLEVVSKNDVSVVTISLIRFVWPIRG